MQTIEMPIKSIVIDTITPLNDVTCQKLKNNNIQGAFRYVDELTKIERDLILNAGLLFGLVTKANVFSSELTIQKAKSLDIPPLTDIYLDVEGTTGLFHPQELKSKINQWAIDIGKAGYTPGMYVGSDCQMNDLDLYRLLVQKYWHSCSRVTDGVNEAGPACGWVCYQLYPPNQMIDGGSLVIDYNCCQKDFKGRSVIMVCK